MRKAAKQGKAQKLTDPQSDSQDPDVTVAILTRGLCAHPCGSGNHGCYYGARLCGYRAARAIWPQGRAGRVIKPSRETSPGASERQLAKLLGPYHLGGGRPTSWAMTLMEEVWPVGHNSSDNWLRHRPRLSLPSVRC
jgi:hypothetical protein